MELRLDTNYETYYENYENAKGDSGFDLYCPEKILVQKNAKGFVLDLKVKAGLYKDNERQPFMIVPRSSMGSKSPFRLANSVGIIDRGYNGSLKVILDNISDVNYPIEKGQRLVQLVPFYGEGVSKVVFGELEETIRGEEGLGSTGQ